MCIFHTYYSSANILYMYNPCNNIIQVNAFVNKCLIHPFILSVLMRDKMYILLMNFYCFHFL